MTAKEMFEDLNYLRMTYNDRFISFVNRNDNDDKIGEVQFDLMYQEVFVDNVVIVLPLFKAIQKQIEELGWNND